MELIEAAKLIVKEAQGQLTFEVRTWLFEALITTIESQKEEIERLKHHGIIEEIKERLEGIKHIYNNSDPQTRVHPMYDEVQSALNYLLNIQKGEK